MLFVSTFLLIAAKLAFVCDLGTKPPLDSHKIIKYTTYSKIDIRLFCIQNPAIQGLTIVGTALEPHDKNLFTISKLPNISYLSLCSCKNITGDGFSHRWSNLKTLKLEGCTSLKDDHIGNIINLPNLKYLEIKNSLLSESLINLLKEKLADNFIYDINCNEKEITEIYGNNQIKKDKKDDIIIENIIEKSTEVIIEDIEEEKINTLISTNEDLAYELINRDLLDYEDRELKEALFLSIQSYRDRIDRKTAHFEKSASLTDESLQQFCGESADDLEELNIIDCPNLTVAGLYYLNLPKLKKLNISKNIQLEECHFILIANLLPQLEELDISYCINLTKESVNEILYFKNLKKIKLDGIKKNIDIVKF